MDMLPALDPNIASYGDMVYHVEDNDGLTRYLQSRAEKLKAEKETVKRVVQNIPEDCSGDEYWQVICLPEKLRYDKEFLLELIGLHEMVFRTIVQSQKDQRIEELVTKFPKLDEEFCKQAYAVNKKCIKYMSKEMKAAVKK